MYVYSAEYLFNSHTIPVADPGFPVGEGADPLGGADLQCIHFLAKTYAKMKKIDPVGGAMRWWCPPWIRQCIHKMSLDKACGRAVEHRLSTAT